jgi:hypothetical protein
VKEGRVKGIKITMYKISVLKLHRKPVIYMKYLVLCLVKTVQNSFLYQNCHLKSLQWQTFPFLWVLELSPCLSYQRLTATAHKDWRRHVPLKCRFTQDLHGPMSQKTAFFNILIDYLGKHIHKYRNFLYVEFSSPFMTNFSGANLCSHSVTWFNANTICLPVIS